MQNFKFTISVYRHFLAHFLRPLLYLLAVRPSFFNFSFLKSSFFTPSLTSISLYFDSVYYFTKYLH
ncbi:hypothetical protein CW304_11825 [Bacillus sp. UFRGS-B20]|nr:hypothetical protein CW304_11825 [Bacillus sp. UFRGS-B20]